jgi:hypothetical protein
MESLVAARKCLRNSVSQLEFPRRLFQKAYSWAYVAALRRCTVIVANAKCRHQSAGA